MHLPSHLDLLSRLLDLEHAADAARFEDAQRTLTLQQRDARGTAIAQLELIDEGALSGRYLLTFARPGGLELGASRMGSGSLGRLRPRLPGCRGRRRGWSGPRSARLGSRRRRG